MIHSDEIHQQDRVQQRSFLMASYIAATVDVTRIREVSLGNIWRWRSQGKENPIWDEWEQLLSNAQDEVIIQTLMDDTDEYGRRLRRASPYVGILEPCVREYIFSKPLTDLPSLDDLLRFQPN